MKKTILFAATLLASIAMNAAVITVASGADLQAKINAAQSGDVVKVQAGTFTGNFTMKEGVQVSGGWNQDFTAQTDYATVLDANASGRVLNQAAAFSTLTVWSNFTIQNGKLTSKQSDEGGAGVFLNKKGRVQHCLIQNNVVAVSSGNAMGGGVSCNSGNADPDTVAYDCVIKNNSATHGGGIRVNGKGIVIYNCVIENNQTTNNAAGGVHMHNGSKLINCIVRNNKANGDTGGVRLSGGNVSDVINCLIVGNVATNQVGGVAIEGNNKANFINNTVVGNKQQKAGATASLSGVKIKNDIGGSGTYFCNNIVWGNITGDTIAPEGVYYISKYDNTKGQRSYNAIQGQAGDDDKTGATSLILTKTDPGFTDAANGDYTLLENSAMVNFGNKSLNTLPYDLAGNQRVRGGKIDLGCYEFLSPEAHNTYVKVGGNLQDSINGTQAGYKVFVEAGIFVGNFTMKDGVDVSGGWNSDFTAQTDYATVLDAQASGRVLNQPGDFSAKTVWSNFTIQNGKLTAAMSDNGGSGVYLWKNGQVKHCIIQNNTFSYQANCLGGGVGNNSVANNKEVLIDSCIIRGNCATHGGGIRICGTIQNSTIENNNTKDVKAGPAGGAHLQGGRMINCIVRGNTSGGDTGGVRLYNACQLIGSLIANNTATNTVGGVAIESKNSDVIGNTIVCNKELKSQTTVSKCGLSCGASDKANGRLSNNIVWGNIHVDSVPAAQIYYVSHYDNRDNNAAIQQKTNGSNSVALSKSNTEDDGDYLAPHFLDPENGDFHLAASSPCLYAGGASYATSFGNTRDLDGNIRPLCGSPAMGCYEPAQFVLDENVDNTKRVANKTINVQIIRTLSSASFNSICLPFALSADQIATAFGADCQIMEMSSAEISGNRIDLNFTDVTEMSANTPYVIQPAAEVVNPTFLGVTLIKSSELDVELSAATFHGLLAPKAMTTGDMSSLFIGANNTLLYPNDDTKIKALRAYITLSADAPQGAQVRMMVNGRNVTTAMPEVLAPATIPADKMMINGQLIIIRDGKMYNALGAEL